MVVEYIAKNSRSGKLIGELIKKVGALHRKILSEVNQQSLFKADQDTAQASVISRVIKQLEAAYEQDQRTLFDKEPADQVSQGTADESGAGYRNRGAGSRKETAEKGEAGSTIEEGRSKFTQGDLFNADPRRETQLELFPVSGLLPGTGTDKGGKDKGVGTGTVEASSMRGRLSGGTRVDVRNTGNLKHSGLAVTSSADAAALLSHLTDLTNEALYTITVDKDSRVLEVRTTASIRDD